MSYDEELFDDENEEIDTSEIALDESVPRKKRTSSVPTDYDPTPSYDNLNFGYKRSPVKCWVDEKIAQPLDLADLHHLWTLDPAGMEEGKRKQRFLASKVVAVAGDFYVKDKTSGLWGIRKKRHEIFSDLMRDWGRGNTKYNIRKETLANFFAGQEYVVLDGTAYIPNAGDFVAINGKRYLNTHHEHTMPFRDTAWDSKPFEALMELVVLNLMGHTDGDVMDWIEAVTSDKSSEIKWMFHWLASQYQRPGKALPTALWLIGRSQGVGKGLFTSGLSNLLGRSNVKIVSAEEFKGDWTDFVMNAGLIVLDEVDFSSRKEAYDKTKRLIGNDTIAARKRHHGDILVPAVANFVFTTNNTMPLALPKEDRRHTFFATMNTQEARTRATAFYDMGSDARSQAWEGMAEFLSMIDINDALIGKAFHTEIKTRMIEGNIDPVEEWLNTGFMLTNWPIGHFAPSEWLAKRYIEWAKEYAFNGCATTKYFHREMSDMALVSKPTRKTLLDSSAKPRGFIRLDPMNSSDVVSVSDAPFILPYQKSGTLLKFQNRVRSA